VQQRERLKLNLKDSYIAPVLKTLTETGNQPVHSSDEDSGLSWKTVLSTRHQE